MDTDKGKVTDKYNDKRHSNVEIIRIRTWQEHAKLCFIIVNILCENRASTYNQKQQKLETDTNSTY